MDNIVNVIAALVVLLVVVVAVIWNGTYDVDAKSRRDAVLKCAMSVLVFVLFGGGCIAVRLISQF